MLKGSLVRQREGALLKQEEKARVSLVMMDVAFRGL